MTTSVLWLAIKAVLVILPLIVQAVRDKQIKDATIQEVVNAIILANKGRADRAVAARDGADNGLSDGFDKD